MFTVKETHALLRKEKRVLSKFIFLRIMKKVSKLSSLKKKF